MMMRQGSWIFVVICLLASTVQVHAIDWDVETVTFGGYQPQVRTDSYGVPHVMHRTSSDYLYYRSRSASSWSAAQLISADAYWWATFDLDANDDPHFVYQRRDIFGNRELKYRHMTAGVLGPQEILWADDQVLPWRGLDVAIDGGGGVHAVALDFASDGSELRYFTRAAAGGWSLDLILPGWSYASGLALTSSGSPRFINQTVFNTALRYYYPDALDPSGWGSELLPARTDFPSDLAIHNDIPHLAYFKNSGGLTHAERNSSWAETVLDTDVPAQEQFLDPPSIVVDENGDPHIVYYVSYNNEIRYARRSGGVWAIEVLAAHPSAHVGGFNPSIDLDVFGNPHIAYYCPPDNRTYYLSKRDCDGDGVSDEDEIANGSAFDCNGNGIPDHCDKQTGAGSDCNGDGTLDSCDADCNGNQISDICEIVQGLVEDCDGDFVPDACELASGSADCNLNLKLDQCEFGPMLTMLGGDGDLAVGDINGDGKSDLLVGYPAWAAAYYEADEGKVFLYYGADPKDTTPDREFIATGYRERFGHSIAVGDLNDDGFDDFAIGGPGPGGGDPRYFDGEVQIFLGAANDADVSLLAQIPALLWKERFGAGVAFVDLNLDGHDDLLVGAPWAGSRVYVYLSNPFDSIADAVLTSSVSATWFGTNVINAGDVDGNGADDLLVLSVVPAKAQILYSQGDGSVVPGPILDGGDDDGSVEAIAAAGDVNDDGYADVLLGEPNYLVGQRMQGRFTLHYGGPAMDDVPDLSVVGSYETYGSPNEMLGHSVRGVGDLNGDSIDDFLVGSNVLTVTGIPGRALLYFGGPGLDTEPDHILTGLENGDLAGYVVGTAGDMDGDGLREVLMMAPTRCGVDPLYTPCTNPFPPYTPKLYLAELESPGFLDCNANQIADVCDIGSGTSADLDQDGVPDECSGLTAVEPYPSRTVLRLEAFPNPFNPATVFEFFVPVAGRVRLEIFDAAGRRVSTLFGGHLQAGNHEYRWNAGATGLASGVYLARLETDGHQVIKRIVLVK